MKQVNPKTYNKNYYGRVYGDVDHGNLNFCGSKEYYKELGNFCKVGSSNTIVDYGCGCGNFSFYMSYTFGCNVIGIDYSQDAIKMSKESLQKLNKKLNKKLNVEFLNLNNDQLPKLENIDFVYLCDVVEHMYDSELNLLMSKIATWNKNNKITILVHTDNKVYLKYARPMLDILNIFLGHMKVSDIKIRREEEDKVHVNLTYPRLLEKKMSKWGFKQKKLKYSRPTKTKISTQLGPLSAVPMLPGIIMILLKTFYFMSPSFMAVYQND